MQVAFSRPLPMPPRIRERCVGILCEALGQSSQAPEAPVTEAVAVKQATLETAMEGETAVETREADIDAAIESEQSANAVRAHRNDGLNKTLSDVTTERDAATAHADAETARGETATAHADAEAERADANSAEVQNFIRELPRGKLHEYRQRATEQLPTKAQRDLAETHFAKYEAELAALQTVFTPQEVQQVFGGNLTETVTLNLASQSKADVYRDVFARIDAGIADEDRRREVRAKVAGQLSREWNTFKALCMTGHEEGLS
ncbi:hypothetical protein EGN72_03125 [Pseudorhodobacter sp. E13]|nr:hypothetical protein EGN72_03125 [Pseudorhodobacter sp. E13]